MLCDVKEPREPRLRFHSFSASRAECQAKETHMVHRWKIMPVCDAELLLSLIYADKTNPQDLELFSKQSEFKMKEGLLTGLGRADLLSRRNRLFLFL